MLILTLINLFIIAATAASCSYWLFYHWAPFIWSFNTPVAANEYLPWVRGSTNGDSGIQVYALYLFMFLNLVFAFVLNAIYLNIKQLLLRRILIIFSFILSFIFLSTIGFHVPMAAPAINLQEYMFVGAVLLATIFLALNDRAWWLSTLIFLSLFILCMITATDMDRTGYIHFFAPAWRFLHGFGFNSYFQYDSLLPILTAGWIKFFPIETITLLGRLSYFALLWGAYVLARSFYKNKQLAIFLLMGMVIIKIYGNIVPPDGIFQVTPLRLDWWILLLAAAYWKSTSHWIVGAGLAFLVLFHHSFGCIYVISYFMFILVLFVLGLMLRRKSLAVVFKEDFFPYFKNLIIILMAFLIYEILLRPPLNVAILYQKIGMGFLRVAKQSFYWYMPCIFAAVFLLLCKNWLTLPRKFFDASILLLCLAIGNSMYFFGRSHENNIINIAAVLLMVFFLMLDLVHLELIRVASQRFSRWAILLMASIVILTISYQYADSAVKLGETQLFNLKNHRVVADSLSDFKRLDFTSLKTLTHSSPKLIFISQMDFFFYYYGKYALPQDYHCYMVSWFMMKDYVNYLNDQLSQGYYIAVNPQEYAANKEIIDGLMAKYISNTADFLVLSHNPLREFNQRLWDR